jgi:hypothetical protein
MFTRDSISGMSADFAPETLAILRLRRKGGAEM